MLSVIFYMLCAFCAGIMCGVGREEQIGCIFLEFLEEFDGSGQDTPAWENWLRGENVSFFKSILAAVPEVC